MKKLLFALVLVAVCSLEPSHGVMTVWSGGAGFSPLCFGMAQADGLCAPSSWSFPAILHAQEAVTLTTPVAKTTSTYTIAYVGLDVANSRIVVQLASNIGDPLIATYDAAGLAVNGVPKAPTPTGATLLHSLNAANFTTNSFVKQVYTRLQTDGVIAAGSVTGSPQ